MAAAELPPRWKSTAKYYPANVNGPLMLLIIGEYEPVFEKKMAAPFWGNNQMTLHSLS